MTLPGSPPDKLNEVWGALTQEQQNALLPHITQDTSADYIADWFKRAGHPVGATSIKLYRRTLA